MNEVESLSTPKCVLCETTEDLTPVEQYSGDLAYNLSEDDYLCDICFEDAWDNG